jgi:DNA-directed RNA polymerase specialized sigma24 family protein
MDSSTYRELLRKAGRLVRNPNDAEDLVQDVLVVALEAGRGDPAWLHGVMRNLAALQARGAVRRRQREQADVPEASVESAEAVAASAAPHVRELLGAMPPSARRTATLALHGLCADEIRWILGLSDTAFRQRLTTIRKAIARMTARSPGLLWLPASPDGAPRSVELQFGIVRRALKAAIGDTAGLGTHDVDGHLLVIHSPAHTSPGRGNQ